MKKTIRQICDENLDTIFVRAQIAGKWGSYSLRELPEPDREKHIKRFEAEGREPHRLLES